MIFWQPTVSVMASIAVWIPSLASALSLSLTRTRTHPHTHTCTHIHFPSLLLQGFAEAKEGTWKCLCELIIEVHNLHLDTCETWQLPSNQLL